jgi:hypothetical protein
VTLGFFLEPLLQSLASPLAAFGFHFHLDLAQGARAARLRLHLFSFWWWLPLAPLAQPFAPDYGGSVKMRPYPSAPGGPWNQESEDLFELRSSPAIRSSGFQGAWRR